MRHHALLYSPMMKLVGELSVYLFGRAGTAIPVRPFFVFYFLRFTSILFKVNKTIGDLIGTYAAGRNSGFFSTLFLFGFPRFSGKFP